VDVRLAQAVALILLGEPLAQHPQHVALDLLVRRPEQRVGDCLDPSDQRAVRHAIAPIGTQMLVEQLRPSVTEERCDVDSVRHEADGIFGRRHVGPNGRAQSRRHLAVDLADAVDGRGTAQRKPRHVEHLGTLRRATEVEQLLRRDAELRWKAGELPRDALGRKHVVTGANRRVSRENGICCRDLERSRKRQTVGGVLAQALENQECGVPFVDVPHRGLQTESAQGAHAADAEDRLLLLPQLAATAIELGRDVSVLGDVLGHIGVQQQHRDTPDGGLPNAHGDGPVERGAADTHFRAVGIQRQHQRRTARIDRWIVRHLLAATVDPLVKVAVAVQQADRDERQGEVTRGLTVIAGEHAQTTRVDREALVPTVLGAKIRNEVAAFETFVRGRPGAEVIVERREDPPVFLDEGGVRGGVVENALVDGPQELSRATLDLAPQDRVERTEQLPERRIPAEPKILRKVVEPLQWTGNAGRNLKCENAARHCKSLRS
jgi:hypothetical protein